jgi:hypothetical protein
MVRATRTVSPASPIAVVQRGRLCAMAAITVQALFALNWPDGKVRERLVFEVADRELHDGVLAVLSLHDLQRLGAVGDEREIPPVRPQLCLRADESGATHDQPSSVSSCLGDLRFTVLGVVLQGLPRRLRDLFDRLGNPELQADSDRVEPARLLEPRDQLLGETHDTALRVRLSFAQPNV